MTVEFDVSEDGGEFQYSKDYDDLIDGLGEILDQRDGGQLSLQAYIAKLKEIVATNPDFIDGHAHLGYALFDQGKPKIALNACLQGIRAGERAIPPDFKGAIEWRCLDNRAFLRAAHGAVLCYLRLGQRQEAVQLMERILAWNPNDNQGIRYMIGSEYLRAGKTDKARPFLEANATQYPPYRYELALLLFREGNRVAAATSLRHGFVENGYIAEILSGNPEPLPLAIWHGSNFAEPELAREYVARYSDLWRRTPEAIAFVRWLHTHPKVMVERAAIFECQEALLWEHDFEQRSLILRKEEMATEQIDDRISEHIVKERHDRHGRPVWPWRYRPIQFQL